MPGGQRADGYERAEEKRKVMRARLILLLRQIVSVVVILPVRYRTWKRHRESS